MRLTPLGKIAAQSASAPRRELRPAPGLSALDAEIIRLLQEDGRRPLAEIARELGLATKAVSKRVGDLRDTGVIDMTAVTEPKALGLRAATLIGLRLDRRRPTGEIVDELWKRPSVDYLSVTGGRFDMIVEIVCRDSPAMLEIIEREIAPVEGIVELEFFPYLSIYYQRFRLDPGQSDAGPVTQNGVRGGELEFDATDRRIIVELNRDGRTPYQEIADELSLSESQVRRRVGRMVDSGGLRIMAMTNPISLGFATMAWLAIRVAPGTGIREVARQLSEVPAVTYIVICSGRFDLFVDVVARDEADLLRLLDQEIRSVPGLQLVEAWIHLDLHWRPLRPPLD